MTLFIYRERGESGQWIKHLLTFDTMIEGLEYAEGLKSGQAWQVVPLDLVLEAEARATKRAGVRVG